MKSSFNLGYVEAVVVFILDTGKANHPCNMCFEAGSQSLCASNLVNSIAGSVDGA